MIRGDFDPQETLRPTLKYSHPFGRALKARLTLRYVLITTPMCHEINEHSHSR
jgi:hypothetical protein